MGHLIFETDRLIVRQYVFETDAENFFRINGDEDVMRYIRPVKSKEDCDDFLKQAIAGYETKPLMGRWAAIEKSSVDFIGSFAFIPVDGTDDSQLGYALLKDYWGKGFATELTKEGIKYVFNNTPLTEVYAITEAANIVSQKVLLKAGFSLYKTYKEDEKELNKFVVTR